MVLLHNNNRNSSLRYRQQRKQQQQHVTVVWWWWWLRSARTTWTVIGLAAVVAWPLASLYIWHTTGQKNLVESSSWKTRATMLQQQQQQHHLLVVKEKVTSSVAVKQRKHVISYEGIPGLDLLAGSIWFGNHACEAIADFRDATKRMRPVVTVLVNVTFGCAEYYHKSSIGSGNVLLLALYMMRASFALLGNVELHFTCHDTYETRSQLVLPWFTGTWYFGAPTTHNHTTLQQEEAACAPFWGAVLDHVYRDMQADVRRMARALLVVGGAGGAGSGAATNRPLVRGRSALAAADPMVSSPSSRSSSSPMFVPHLSSSPKEEPPLFNVDLDDAVIHFRCGDLLTSDLAGYGFWTFDGYVRHISSEARSIGILTQPFPENNTNVQQRYMDNADAVQKQRCKTPRLHTRASSARDRFDSQQC
jgi:hypothetical protein